MNLGEFFDYKNKLMEDLCSNETIVKLLTENDEASVPNAGLRYTQLFPFEKIPDSVSEARTFICFDVDIDSVSKGIYLPVLYVWPFTHKSKLRMPQGGLLLDQLSIEIDKMLNGSRYFGMGELKLTSVGRFVPTTDYLGRSLMYTAMDWNMRPASRPVPTNRKAGK